MRTLATIEYREGNANESERLLREAIEINRAKFGGQHLTTLRLIKNLSLLHLNVGENNEALNLNEAVLANFDPNSFNAAMEMYTLLTNYVEVTITAIKFEKAKSLLEGISKLLCDVD